MELLVGAVLLLALVKKFVDLLKQFKSDRSAALTQLVVFAVAIGVVFLFAATPFAAGVSLAGVALAGAAVATKVIFGLCVGAAASLTEDGFRALDNSQTAALPKLFK